MSSLKICDICEREINTMYFIFSRKRDKSFDLCEQHMEVVADFILEEKQMYEELKAE